MFFNFLLPSFTNQLQQLLGIFKPAKVCQFGNSYLKLRRLTLRDDQELGENANPRPLPDEELVQAAYRSSKMLLLGLASRRMAKELLRRGVAGMQVLGLEGRRAGERRGYERLLMN